MQTINGGGGKKQQESKTEITMGNKFRFQIEENKV